MGQNSDWIPITSNMLIGKQVTQIGNYLEDCTHELFSHTKNMYIEIRIKFIFYLRVSVYFLHLVNLPHIHSQKYRNVESGF